MPAQQVSSHYLHCNSCFLPALHANFTVLHCLHLLLRCVTPSLLVPELQLMLAAVSGRKTDSSLLG